MKADNRRRPALRLVPAPPAGPELPSTLDSAALLDELFQRHSRYVAAIAIRLLGRDGDIDDVVQDVFMEAMSGIARLRDPNAVRGWLARITVRKSVRRLRKLKLLRTFQIAIEPAHYEQLAAPSASADQRALLARTYQALDRLPARTRVIWILRHVLDEPLHAIVEYTACSQSTVQRKLRDAEDHLEEELRDE
jgi:RNA polymerase sigma-70 factor (ECF subfamily)